MLFTSLTFILCFLPSTLFIYYVLLKPSRKLQNYFLFFVSLLFYAWGEPRFVFVLFFSILCNWIFGLLIRRYRNRIVIAMMLTFNLGMIFVFKYLYFTVGNLNAWFGAGLSVPRLALPIGISFFTFQAISYGIDIYRGKAEAQKNPIHVGLYIAFFPELLSGPIVRYELMARQINDRRESVGLVVEGANRFLIGFCKKVLIANNMALIADHCFRIAGEGGATVTLAWLGAVAYTLQIFFDFSGYSDMAIGLARMFGFVFPENFNYPYISKSAAEFWRRWHISLGSWFRDYVYIPLGGNRQGRMRTYFNLLVVWFLTGFWHGANWTFICWGLMWCFFIGIEKSMDFEKKNYYKFAGNSRVSQNLLSATKHFYMVLLIIVGWVIFRSESMGAAVNYLNIMSGTGDVAFNDVRTLAWIRESLWFLVPAIAFSMPLGPQFNRFVNSVAGNKSGISTSGSIVISLIYSLGILLLFVVAVSYLVKGMHNPFIYFNF